MPGAHSFRDEAIARAKAGIPPRVLAAEYGVAPRVLHQMLKDARRAGEDIPRFANGAPALSPDMTRMTCRIGRATRAALVPAAQARGLSVAELAGALLAAIAEGALVDAVLDDGEGAP
ncbi:hypothetical protein DSD19_06175 [Rhodovulum sp. BSW8]|uniref:hypothetical protein n=1 Tax=Rhodovulum sp. BSW8 TaxID=2259645 RepID=UPI000DE21CFB|nr:hypothetical protein [Rhodovulum sp. BSW8]RBO54047.1 hypothetical protein DSD19_06175 [Rhodovulum sp. BSW8]